MNPRHRLQALRELNPLWVLSLGVVLLAVAAGGLVQRHLHDSTRLEDRLSGSALVDALRLYAEAAAPGQPVRPDNIGQLVDDVRSGQHRAWLDTVSAAALADPQRWQPVRDAEGRLMGVQQRAGAQAGGLWSWLDRADDPAPSPYVLTQVPAQAAAPEAPPAVELPQPVMPVDGLPALKLASGTAAPNAATPNASAPAAAQVKQVAHPAAPGSHAGAPVEAAAGLGLKPSRIIAGLEARQVLRLSGGGDEPPLVVPRRNPAPAPAAAATAAGQTALAPIRAGRHTLPPASSARAAAASASQPASVSASAAAAAAAAAAPVPVPVQAPVARKAAAAQSAAGPDRSAPGLPVPPLPGVPQNVPLAPPTASGTRVDTVIFEEPPAAALPTVTDAAPVAGGGTALPAPVSCRALAGDSAECDALDDSNGGLYQRCYQSLSERINACLAGDPLPPLVTR